MYMTDEEDQILKSKGDMEASLMKKPKPIKPFKFRSTGGFGGGGGSSGGGLGGKPKSKKAKSKGGKKPSSKLDSRSAKSNVDIEEDPDSPMVQAIVRTLKTDGIVRLDDVMSGDKADSLRDYLIDLRSRATEQVESGVDDEIQDSQERFADVLLNRNRCDLKIPLGPKPVHQALLDLLVSQSPSAKNNSGSSNSNVDNRSSSSSNNNRNYSIVRKVIEGVFETYGGVGQESTLWELNCFMSNSGARRQLVHADNVCLEPVPGLHPTPSSSSSSGGVGSNDDESADEPILLTCFVALQDIDAAMGPTIFMPGTHTLDAHNRFFETGRDESSTKTESYSPKNDVLRSSPSVMGAPILKGSCLIFDPRVLHCAGENTCADPDKTRALFYMSFKNPKVDSPGCPSTSGYGIGTAELTMDELVREVAIYESDVIDIDEKFTPRLSSLLSFP